MKDMYDAQLYVNAPCGRIEMEVEANVWYWTPEGMRETPSSRGGKTGYVEMRAVEQLLEEAHRRGYQERQQEEGRS